MGLIPSPSTVQSIIEDTKVLLAQLQGVQISYAPRKANKPANRVAKAYRDNRLPHNWVLYPPYPFSVSVLLCNDLELNGKCFIDPKKKKI